MKSTVHNLHSFNREGIKKMTKKIWNNKRGKIDYAVLLTTQQKGISKQQAAVFPQSTQSLWNCSFTNSL